MSESARWHTGAAALTLVLCFGWTSTASAQGAPGGEPIVAPLTTTILGTTVVGTGVVITVLMTNSDGGDGESKAAFLRRHRFALQRGIAVGGGRGVRALADAFGVEPDVRGSFGRMLRQRREQLLPLVEEGPIDAARAATFFRRVADGMRSHPILQRELVDIGWSRRHPDSNENRH